VLNLQHYNSTQAVDQTVNSLSSSQVVQHFAHFPVRLFQDSPSSQQKQHGCKQANAVSVPPFGLLRFHCFF
jgi:hypothetical protein